MIKTYTRVPEVYYKESRDFQLLGRIYDFIFNYNKTGIDLIKNNPISDNSDTKLLDLVSSTLGFESKHNYSITALRALAQSFVRIIRKKGSLEAIEDCIRLLLRAQNLNAQPNIERFDYENDTHGVTIYIPAELKDISLLEDMLDYILPAGYVYEFKFSSFGGTYRSAYKYRDRILKSTIFNMEDVGVIGIPESFEMYDTSSYEIENYGLGIMDDMVVVGELSDSSSDIIVPPEGYSFFITIDNDIFNDAESKTLVVLEEN